jgi:tetratricopeptide (TPR) repeat protein
LLSFSLLATCHSPAFAAFRDQGWGTRAAGMGGAYVASADDAQSPAYNPAGLARLDASEVSIMYAKPFAGLDLKTGADGSTSLGMSYLSAAAPLGRWGVLGASWAGFNVQTIYREDAYALTYAKRFGEARPLNLGVSLKRLSTEFTLDSLTRATEGTSALSPFKDGTKADALSADVGAQFRLAEPLWLGFSARNVNSPDIGLRQEDRVPREYRLGAAWTARDVGPLEEVTSSLEFARRAPAAEAPETRPLFGVESWFLRRVYALRFGGNDRELAFGAAYRQTFARFDLRLDYAFALSSQLDDSGATHRVSLSLRGGGAEGDSVSGPKPIKATSLLTDASMAVSEGEWDRAEALYLRFLAECPADASAPSVYGSLGRLQMLRGRWEEAQSTFLKLLIEHPSAPSAREAKASLRRIQPRLQRAQAASSAADPVRAR